MPLNTDIAVMVGAGKLPIADDTPIADIVVRGDTVYVSIDHDAGATDDPGIFYSQALFDETGKVVRWTPWTKRAVPFDSFPHLDATAIPDAQRGNISFFDVDPFNGKIWAVSGSPDKKSVIITGWTINTDANSLVEQLQEAIRHCSTSVLDLDQATRGIGQKGKGRYALFSGISKVIFTRISESKAGAAPFDIASGKYFPQTVTPDFSLATNFLTTSISGTDGNVNVLEYSRTAGGIADSYFFAGTNSGLFVFADAGGAGFDVTAAAPNALNAAPFTGRTWQKAPNITGAIIDIKTSGRALYVLTQTTSPAKPLQSCILKIPFKTTIAAMFAPGNISVIAASGVGTLATTCIFFEMQIIATDDPLIATSDDKEQLVIATNNGIYRSNADQSGAKTGISDVTVTTQTDAVWTLIPTLSTSAYSSLKGIDTPIGHTIWPIRIADSSCGNFNKSALHQMSGAGTPGAGDPPLFNGFIPTQFNSSESDSIWETINMTTNFWSDGARRFLITIQQEDPSTINRLTVLPFRTDVYNVTPPPIPLTDPALKGFERFYWIRQIGVSGVFLAGTSTGVTSLE